MSVVGWENLASPRISSECDIHAELTAINCRTPSSEPTTITSAVGLKRTAGAGARIRRALQSRNTTRHRRIVRREGVVRARGGCRDPRSLANEDRSRICRRIAVVCAFP